MTDRRWRTSSSLLVSNSVAANSDTLNRTFPSLTVCLASVGPDLRCHGTVFSTFLCMPEHLGSFLSLLLVDYLPASWSVFSWVITKTCDDRDPRELYVEDRLTSRVSGSNPHVDIFGNMKLIFAVFLLVTVWCVSLSFWVWGYVIWISSDKELCRMFFRGGAEWITDQNGISPQVGSLRDLMEPKTKAA